MATFYLYLKLPTVPAVKQGGVQDELNTIAGWGKTSENGFMSSRVRQAEVPILPMSVCEEAYPHQITDTMMCAGNMTHGSLGPCTVLYFSIFFILTPVVYGHCKSN